MTVVVVVIAAVIIAAVRVTRRRPARVPARTPEYWLDQARAAELEWSAASHRIDRS